MKILSLFDGISCARVAAERAGFKVERYVASEIDKYAIQISQKNYPDIVQLGSVVGLKAEVLHLSGVYDMLREYDTDIQNKLSEQEMLYWLNEDFSISAKIGTQITNADSPESASLQRIEEIWFSRSGVGDIIKTQKLIGSRVVGENGNTQTQELLLQCGEWGYVYRSDTRDTKENINGIDGQKIENREHRKNTTSGTFTMGDTAVKKETIGTDEKRNVETPKSQEISDRTEEQKEWGTETAGNRKEYERSKVQNVSFPLQAKNDNEAITEREWLQLSVRKEMETTMVKTANSINIFLGKFEIMCGGSPCQDLSIAKKNREGLAGSRSGLFWEFVRIRDEAKPRFFVLENVNSMPKEAKQTITEALGVEPVMINAALVSAQNRKRLFWVGKWNGKKYEQVIIPQPEDRGILLKDVLELEGEFNGLYSDYNNSTTFDKARTIGSGVGITRSATFQQVITKPVRIAKIGKGGQGDRVYDIKGKSDALSANGGGRGAKTGLYLIKAPNGKDMEIDLSKVPHLFKEVRTEEGKKSRHEIRKATGRDTTKRGKNDKKYSPQDSGKANCITTGLGVEGLLAVKDYVRKLTPLECSRLQSLPDGYVDAIGVSNTQKYKALGNAFNVEVVAHILKHL